MTVPDNRPMSRLIVGLGNPGPEYALTRHNAGFWWVEAAADSLGVRFSHQRAFHGLVARVDRPSGPTWLLEPLTYMNLCGKAVAALARFYKIAPEQILVVHDELDLTPGQAKLKQGGGVAGHNGLKDIRAQLGSSDFWRLRLGIGHPGVRAEVVDWVLRRPDAAQRDAIHGCIARTLEALPLLLDGEMDRATMTIHARPPRPKPPREPSLATGDSAPPAPPAPR